MAASGRIARLPPGLRVFVLLFFQCTWGHVLAWDVASVREVLRDKRQGKARLVRLFLVYCRLFQIADRLVKFHRIVTVLLLEFAPNNSFVGFGFVMFRPNSRVRFRVIACGLGGGVRVGLRQRGLRVTLLSRLSASLRTSRVVGTFGVGFAGDPCLVAGPRVSASRLYAARFKGGGCFVPLTVKEANCEVRWVVVVSTEFLVREEGGFVKRR